MANRITTAMMYTSMVGTLQTNLQKLLDLQNQIATEKKYSKLSDNPSEIARALSLSSSIKANTQYITNQTSGKEMLLQSETLLDSVLNDLQTIRAKVIEAGNGTLDATGAAALADEIDTLKDSILTALNTKIAGKYVFGGTNTSSPPFVMDESGQITYVGSDERIRYEIEQGVLSDVSFTGADVMPSEYQSYFICSHYVDLDWKWTGREEKVQITVGDRTLAVYIPESWIDEVAAGSDKSTDYNQFRDPEELSSISLDDLAALVNRALTEQGADMLVTPTVEKDYDSNQQRLVFKSNTGEPISVTGWPDTDYLPMAQTVAGLTMDDTALQAAGYWNQGQLTGSAAPDFATMGGKSLTVYLDGTPGTVMDLNGFFTAYPASADQTAENLAVWMNSSGALPVGVTAGVVNGNIAFTSASGGTIQIDGTGVQTVTGGVSISKVPQYQGLMGTVNTLGWKGDGLGKQIEITAGGVTETFNLDDYKNISELAQAINAAMPTDAGDADFALTVAGRLVLQSTRGPIEVKDTGTPGGTMQLFGYDGSGDSLKSSSSSLTIQLDGNQPIKIYINDGDTLEDIAGRVNAIEGIYARTSADGGQLVIVAQRTGDAAEDPLAADTATENLHYPSFTLWGKGMAMSLFGFAYGVDADTDIETGSVSSEEQTRPTDHSHMDVFDYLGMETALKSREYEQGEVITVAEGTELHWRITSGSHTTEIKILPGTYTLAQLAERLKNAGAGWLEVDIDVTGGTGVPGSDDDEIGLGTSANAEAATSRLVIRSTNGSPVVFMDMNEQRYAEEIGLSTALRTDGETGVDTIVLPTAPCVDENLAAAVRVQMTCGKTYDLRLARKDITHSDGSVDRVKVMEQIADQVNAQAGYEVMKVVIPVDGNGQKLTNSASLVAVTGEPFEVVDLPVLDPNWSDSYTAGIAAQLGIHGGVTSNLELAGIQDDTKMGVTGTIRFESLGRSIEIDVTENDTVKTIMDRLRSQAGDWLYVNYFDAEMGSSAGQEGNYPIIAIAAKDGSAVNVIDVKGTVAEDKLLLSTGIQGTQTFYDINGDLDTSTWPSAGSSGTPLTFSITVAGYTHTIDLTAMRDINGNGVMDAEDLVEEINARMQDYDVKAEMNEDGKLVLWSPRGYSIKIGGVEDSTDVSTFFTTGSSTAGTPGTPSASSANAYRGGYGLGDAALRGEYAGVYAQNVVTRSGANQAKQNFFGLLDDISAAVRAENRDGLSDKLLPQIDRAIDTLLRITATSGALQLRYENNIARMTDSGLYMTEIHDSLVSIDLTEITTELMMAQAVYQASLGVISYIVQPTLVDFLT